jgi:hypothetical protein
MDFPRPLGVLLCAWPILSCQDGILITLGHAPPPTGSAVSDGGNVVRPGTEAGSDSSIGVCPGCCAPGVRTTVSGTVYDPAGKVPLYNVIVYVPHPSGRELIKEGLFCDQCSGNAISAISVGLPTDAAGHFELETPSGPNVPLVIQIGKWQRQINVPVTACQDNPITDRDVTRLPRNSSEGHLPRIALTTGHSDALECLLRRIGIDDSEFTTDSGPGRVHMFFGCDGGSGLPANQFAPERGGAKFADAQTLWMNMEKLKTYDMLVMSCEGSQCEGSKENWINNIQNYANLGGRLFLDHLHFFWLRNGPDPWPMTADYVGPNADDLPSPFTVKVDTGFPKGEAFANWLVATNASATNGTMTIIGGQFSVRRAIDPFTQQWIFTDQNPNDSQAHAVEYMTMNTPAGIDASSQCGRVVFTDLHVVPPKTAVDSGPGMFDVSHSDTPFPRGCLDKAELTAQEKALEFMFFDLSSCVQKDTLPVSKPEIR